MHTTLTPSCLHDATLCSLKNPRSPPYKSGAWPKACLWLFSEAMTCCSSTGFPSSTSYCVIKPRAFGEEHLVTELDRRLHLAALDEVGMGFENRIELLGSWNLLAVEHTAARLIDHTGSQTTKVLDLLARFRDHHVGDHISAMRLAGIPQHHACALPKLLGNAD